MEVLIIFLIASITFITRVVNLLNIPIFTDEAIYIRWAQIGLNDPAHRYISLTDGKQPLLTWFMYPMLKIFSDPLFAGRFVSVLTGVGSVLGIYFVGKKLFNQKTGILGSIIYILSPFALTYDRLALMDSLLAFFGIWSLYLEIILFTKLRFDVALILGITIGLGVLTKSSAFFYLYLIPVGLLLFNFHEKKIIKRLVKLSIYSFVALIITQVIYNSLRLSPWFYIIRQKNYSFIMTIPQFLKSPFSVLVSNLKGLFPILITYITWPLFITLIIGLLISLFKKEKKILFLFIWFILPFFALAAFGIVIMPRFILFMTYPLFIILAFTINSLAIFISKFNRWAAIFFIFLLMAYPIFQSYILLTKPVFADIPQSDRNQLFNDWPSGFGVKEVVAFISNKAKYGKVVIGTEGTFGLFPASLEMYLGLNKNIEIKGYWPVSEVPPDLLKDAEVYPTYLVFKEKQVIPSDWPLILISKYRRGIGDTYLLFYQVVPKNSRR